MRDSDLAAQQAGLDAHERERLGQSEGGADLFAVLAGLERRRQAQVVGALFGRAAFVDGRQAEIAGQAARGGAGIHPGQLEGDQRQRQVFRSLKEPAEFRVEEGGGDAALVEGGAAGWPSRASIRASCDRRRRRAGPPVRAPRAGPIARAWPGHNGRQSAT